MDTLSKFERIVHGWLKGVPHLPHAVRSWIGENVWWMVAIALVLTGIAAISSLVTFLGSLSMIGGQFAAYYPSVTFLAWASVTAAVTCTFAVVQTVIFAFAIAPLRERQKQGWVLLFASWLLSVLSVFAHSVLTLNVFSFITNLIFGALWLAVGAYFLFEIHGQFAHPERSKGVKKES